MAIKVLYICPNGYIGGAERFVLEATKGHLSSQKIQPFILFFNEGPATKAALESGIDHYILKNKVKLSSPVKMIKAWREIRKLVKNLAPHIVHFTMPYSVLSCYPALVFLDIKKVWFQHGPIGGPLDPMAALLPVDMVMFNSIYLQQVHSSIPSINRPIEQIINLAIAEVEVDEVNTKVAEQDFNQFEKNRPTLIMAGRICEWKGIHLFISALGVLKRRKGLEFNVAVIGGANSVHDKEYEQQLKQQAKDNNLNIHFTGFRPAPNAYFKKADLVVHASTIPEPFGLVVAEAMKCGTLVLGSSRGGVSDILQNEKTGLTFDSIDGGSEALYQKLSTWYELYTHNNDYLKSLATAGKKHIDLNYSSEQMEEELHKSYSSLLS